MEDLLPFLMFPVLLLFLLSGYPVAFVLSGTALIFAFVGAWLDLFYLEDLGFVPIRVFGITSNLTLLAVPLFIFMGLTLEKSGVARQLLKSMSYLFRGTRGSMYLSVVLVGALLAASTGIVGATVVTMGVLSLPTMIQSGYKKELSCGIIAASGTLGQIIPPSIVLILLGEMMNVDVGDLFAGALIPGVLLVFLYLGYAFIRSEEIKPTLEGDSKISIKTHLNALLPPLLLVITVLGSILVGIASPTEAAACGGVGAIIIGYLKGQISSKSLLEIGRETALTTSMVFMILVGAQFFGVVFRGLGGDELIISAIDSLGLDRTWILLALMVLLFFLGFFLDFLEICFIIVPIILPVMNNLGFDTLWLAVLIALNLQTSFLTPPFGFALFYLKGVAPKEIETIDIYRGVLPFVGIQIFALAIIIIFPQLVLWLPRIVFN